MFKNFLLVFNSLNELNIFNTKNKHFLFILLKKDYINIKHLEKLINKGCLMQKIINVEAYIEKELAILPVKGKRPYHNDWYHIDYNECFEHYSWHGVGLKCGQASGIICLDFDSKDENIKEKIKQLLPPLFSGKIGNPKKLPTMFFQYNEEESCDLRNIEVQLLSTGKQTVLPPTIHPELDKKFEWIGNPLIEIDIDDLPYLNKDLWKALETLNETTVSSNNISNKLSTGRNNALKTQVVAAVTSGKQVDEIIQEVIQYDQINHSPPLFEDTSEASMQGSVYQNALGFVCRNIGSLTKNKKVVIDEPARAVNNSDKVTFGESFFKKEGTSQIKSRKFLKLPKLIGIGNEIFHELYDGAPIPRTQFAFQNTMFLLSLMIGNKAMYRGTGLNLYTYSVGQSACGKDYPFKRTQQILKLAKLEHLIGPSSPTSETSILKFLEEHREKGCWWNEGEKVLKLMSNPRTNFGVLECVTDLYDGVGKPYFNKGTIGANGELKKFGDIYSPFLSINMASTTSAFNKNANTSMFETGLLNRFDIYFEDRYKRLNYRDNYNPPIKHNIVSQISDIANKKPLLDDASAILTIPNLKEDPKNKAFGIELFEQIVKDNEKYLHDKFYGFISRKYLRVNKYTALHHFMKFGESFLMERVTKESMQWGYDCANAVMHNMMNLLPNSVSENDYERSSNRILEKIIRLNESGKSATKSSIANGLNGIKVKLRNEILVDLLEKGVITQDKSNNYIYI